MFLNGKITHSGLTNEEVDALTTAYRLEEYRGVIMVIPDDQVDLS